MGEFSKILSFSFRLFGNVFAGEVLLMAGASMLILATGVSKTWFGIPGGLIQLPFYTLEILVGFIQAFVFSALTLVFISVFTAHAKH
ncbi:F0F1 ATP synthase subunit A [Candidatus Microgenomates bacterium]|nr:F0F1 ATP synthase subunit A [Candidatus Microgenomates bacterium]